MRRSLICFVETGFPLFVLNLILPPVGAKLKFNQENKSMYPCNPRNHSLIKIISVCLLLLVAPVIIHAQTDRPPAAASPNPQASPSPGNETRGPGEDESR